DLRVVSGDAGVHGDLGEVAADEALRVLHAREAHAGLDLQGTDFFQNGRVVGRNAFVVEVLDLVTGSVDTLVEIVQGRGLHLEGAEFDLFAGEDIGGMGAEGGPVEGKAGAEHNDGNQQEGETNVVPRKRRGEPLL